MILYSVLWPYSGMVTLILHEGALLTFGVKKFFKRKRFIYIFISQIRSISDDNANGFCCLCFCLCFTTVSEVLSSDDIIFVCMHTHTHSHVVIFSHTCHRPQFTMWHVGQEAEEDFNFYTMCFQSPIFNIMSRIILYILILSLIHI